MRLDTLLAHGVFTVGIAGLGLFVRLTHDNTRRGRWISWLAYGLTLAAFFSAGLLVAMFDWSPAKEYLGAAFGGGGFGFLCGLALGRFVWKHYRKEVEGDDE